MQFHNSLLGGKNGEFYAQQIVNQRQLGPIIPFLKRFHKYL